MITMHPGNFGFFGGFPILFSLVFAFVLGVFIYILFSNFRRNRQDNNSPRITAEATVVTKRTHVWGDHSHTDYYVTFQFASGDRQELAVPHNQFGYLVEGDKGRLTFQGNRFLEFQRT